MTKSEAPPKLSNKTEGVSSKSGSDIWLNLSRKTSEILRKRSWGDFLKVGGPVLGIRIVKERIRVD